MTTGVAPGIGKTTLIQGLAARADATAIDLDLFEVDQIFTRPEFVRIGQAFRNRTYPTAEMMLEGYARLLRGLERRDMVLFDWSCPSKISDLS